MLRTPSARRRNDQRRSGMRCFKLMGPTLGGRVVESEGCVARGSAVPGLLNR
jgi:hypothetical protein